MEKNMENEMGIVGSWGFMEINMSYSLSYVKGGSMGYHIGE